MRVAQWSVDAQVISDSGLATEKTDVFSLGLCVWQIFSCVPPFARMVRTGAGADFAARAYVSRRISWRPLRGSLKGRYQILMRRLVHRWRRSCTGVFRPTRRNGQRPPKLLLFCRSARVR